MEEFLRITEPKNVLEVGGWKGELANDVLKTNHFIQKWHNVEFTTIAVDESVPTDSRYHPIEPSQFRWWEKNEPGMQLDGGYDVLVLSHVIEHFKLHDIAAMMARIHVKYIYIDAPLELDWIKKGWKDYNGGHVINGTFEAVDNIMKECGYVKFHDHAEFIKFYKKA